MSFAPFQQLAPLTSIAAPELGNSIFPPTGNTVAGATQPPFARIGAGFLNAILPTNGVPQVQSPFATETLGNSGAPTGLGTNAFSASYGPEIYAVYVNGLIAQGSVLETNISSADIARPAISGDPAAPVPGAPEAVPVAAPEGTQQVIAALTPLAGSGQIFTPGTGQTATASTAAAQSSASRSSSTVATK